MKALKFKSSGFIILALMLALGISTAALSQQSVGTRGVVGDGTAGSCTQAALTAQILAGGTVTFNCAPGENTIGITGSIVINTGVTVTIDGSNNGEEIILSNVGAAGGNSRVLDITTVAANVTLQNLTIQNGNINGSGNNGGGIRVNQTGSTLNVTNVHFLNNHSQGGSGGAIHLNNGVTATITQSSFVGNQAGSNSNGGGAVSTTGSGTNVVITNSTFSGNAATVEGGVGGALRVGNNSAVNLTNNTFVNNTSVSGGSTLSLPGAGTLAVANNIIVGGGTSCNGTLADGGGNVIPTGNTCAGIAAASTGDPLLGALTTDSDGPTQYYPIGVGSSAFNLAPCGTLTVDQIGTARPQGAACDSGAIELITEVVVTETPTETEEVPVDTPTATEEIPVDTPTATEEIPVDTPTATEEIPVDTPTATEEIPVDTPTSTEEAPEETATATEGTPAEETATATEGTPGEETPTATEGTPAEETPTATEGTPIEETATATATETEDPGVELVVNGSFEIDDDNNSQPDSWTTKNPTKEKVKCKDAKKDYAFDGDCAYRFKGVPGEKSKLLQKPSVEGINVGDTLNLSLYVNTKIAAAGKIATVTIKYTDTSAGNKGDGQDKIHIQLTAPTAGNTYENRTGSMVVASAPSGLKIQLRNKNTSGKIFFDAVSLTVVSGSPVIGLP